MINCLDSQRVTALTCQETLQEAFSNKQGAKDPTYKNADVAIFTVLSIDMKEQGGYDSRSADQIRRRI